MATVLALDHVNIQTVAVAETARFFADVLELRAGPVVPGGDMAQVTWMYDAADRPLVHITVPGATWAEDRDRPLRPDTGALHHVAFECSGDAGAAGTAGHRLAGARHSGDRAAAGVCQRAERRAAGAELSRRLKWPSGDILQ